MRRLVLAGLLTLGTLGLVSLPPVEADPPTDCSAVTCLVCPEGERPLGKAPNCCLCVPDRQPQAPNCDAVRCEACPEGFRNLLQPNNCCRCVPDPQG
jgi:hypothetical protein